MRTMIAYRVSQLALGCVFLSGIAFLVLTLLGVRQLIMNAVTRALFAAAFRLETEPGGAAS